MPRRIARGGVWQHERRLRADRQPGARVVDVDLLAAQGGDWLGFKMWQMPAHGMLSDYKN